MFSQRQFGGFDSSAFGILVHNDFTSREKKVRVVSNKVRWLIFLRKFVVSWAYDGIS